MQVKKYTLMNDNDSVTRLQLSLMIIKLNVQRKPLSNMNMYDFCMVLRGLLLKIAG